MQGPFDMMRNKLYCNKCHPNTVKKNKMRLNYIKMMENPMDKFITKEDTMKQSLKDIGME